LRSLMLGDLNGGKHRPIYSLESNEVTADTPQPEEESFRSTFCPSNQKQAVLRGLTTQVLDATRCAEILKEIAPLFESGALKPLIASEKYPLSEATQAYRCTASGKSGKVVLITSGTDMFYMGRKQRRARHRRLRSALASLIRT
jgi:hypothetical protein